MRRVVVTGLGAVTPLGVGVRGTWDAVLAGTSGVGPITRFDATGFSTTIAAEVKGFDPERFIDRKEIKRMDPFIHYAMASAHQALADAARGLPGVAVCRDHLYSCSEVGQRDIAKDIQQFELNRMVVAACSAPITAVLALGQENTKRGPKRRASRASSRGIASRQRGSLAWPSACSNSAAMLSKRASSFPLRNPVAPRMAT